MRHDCFYFALEYKSPSSEFKNNCTESFVKLHKKTAKNNPHSVLKGVKMAPFLCNFTIYFL